MLCSAKISFEADFAARPEYQKNTVEPLLEKYPVSQQEMSAVFPRQKYTWVPLESKYLSQNADYLLKCNHASSDYVTFFWPGFAKSTVSTHFCGPYCVWTFLYRQTNCAPHEEKGKRRQELTTELQSVCSAIIITHSESLSLVYTKLSFFTQCHLIYAEDLTYMWVEDNYSVKKWKWLLSKKVLYIITMPNA